MSRKPQEAQNELQRLYRGQSLHSLALKFLIEQLPRNFIHTRLLPRRHWDNAIRKQLAELAGNVEKTQEPDNDA